MKNQTENPVEKHPAAVTLGRMKKGVKEKPSEAKAKSSRENGKKGGRPKKMCPLGIGENL